MPKGRPPGKKFPGQIAFRTTPGERGFLNRMGSGSPAAKLHYLLEEAIKNEIPTSETQIKFKWLELLKHQKEIAMGIPLLKKSLMDLGKTQEEIDKIDDELKRELNPELYVGDDNE